MDLHIKEVSHLVKIKNKKEMTAHVLDQVLYSGASYPLKKSTLEVLTHFQGFSSILKSSTH